jgi:hypothetical protein
MGVRLRSAPRSRPIRCAPPLANGSVDATGSGEFRATIEVRDGGQLVSRNSSTFEEKAKVHGRVGADAKLKSIEVEHTEEVFIVASGGIVVRGGVTRRASIEMPGGQYDPAGASVKFFGDSIAGDSGAKAFASTAAAISAYRSAEPRWSTFNPSGGYCAEPAFSPALLLAGSDPEDRDHLGLLRLGVDDVGARPAAEPAGVFVVADEDSGMVPPVAVLDPDPVALLEAVRLIAHIEEPSLPPKFRPDPPHASGGGAWPGARPTDR